MDNQTVSLTASNIRYLLAVKQLTDQGARVRCVDVAKHLEVARPSAMRALEYLGTLGIFVKTPQGIWSLTQSGQELAQRYRTYYDTVETMLCRLLPPAADRPGLALNLLSEVPLSEMDGVCQKIRNASNQEAAV